MKPAPIIGSTVAALAGWFIALGTSPAGPGPALCFDQRLCGDLSDVYYCPDTGAVASAFAPCPSLVTGPYRPGGLRPNEGLTPLG